MEYKETVKKVIAEVCRLLLGVVFIFSGTVKAVDPMGGAIKIGDYLTSFGLDKLQPFTVLISFNLSALEFMLGVCMLLGVYRRYTTFLTLLMMSFMTPLTLYLAIFNPVSDCGCFGDALVISNWQTFYKNVVLLAAAIYVFIHNQRLLQGYTYHVYWFVALWAYVFAIGFAYRNYNHLPILDFRPYKLGATIPALMSIPEGAPEDEYAYSFIYEKDGVQKEFSLENYPDSTWKFIEARTIVKEKGYEPSIHDFSMTNLETGEDITEEVLSDKNYTFLLVAHRIEEADDSNIDLINEIYDYAVEHGYRFYCLTSSLDDQIEQWKDKTGAEYPFCLMDDITLKTMIRSNPGLMLIKEGTILNKWSDSELPDEYALTDKLENLELGKQKEESDVHTIGYVLLWFAIPLLMVLGVDILVVKRLEKRRKRAAEKAVENSKSSSEA